MHTYRLHLFSTGGEKLREVPQTGQASTICTGSRAFQKRSTACKSLWSRASSLKLLIKIARNRAQSILMKANENELSMWGPWGCRA